MAAKFLIGYSTPTVKNLRFSSPSPLDYALERVSRYKRFSLVFLFSVFRIRIRSDPYHLAGSGSVSGNVDLDPGTKKKS